MIQKCNNNIVQYKDLDIQIGSFKIKTLLNKSLMNRINKIMHLSYTKLDKFFKNNQFERGLPSDVKFIKNGWYKYMLARYIISTKFTNNKVVLDSCAGFGWGSYILASNVKKIYVNDYNIDAINFINSYWKEKRIKTILDDALNLTLPEKVDVVVAMESIEHFSKKKGIKYINRLIKNLKQNGILIGSSSFPLRRKDADILCNKNPHHRYIHTLDEINKLLKKYFKNIKILENKFFICKNL